MKKLKEIVFIVSFFLLLIISGCKLNEQTSMDDISSSEYQFIILNDARDLDIQVDVLNQEGELIKTITVPSKKESYNLGDCINVSSVCADVSSASEKDINISLKNIKQNLIIIEKNRNLSQTFNFDPENGKYIYVYVSGPQVAITNEDWTTSNYPSGYITIEQSKTLLGLL